MDFFWPTVLVIGFGLVVLAAIGFALTAPLTLDMTVLKAVVVIGLVMGGSAVVAISQMDW